MENWDTKMPITRKIKILNLIFLPIQHIPHLSCKYLQFCFIPHQKTSRAWIFILVLVDPSRNRLASTAYFSKVSSVFCMHGYEWCIHQNEIIFFFKSGQTYKKKIRNRLNKKNNEIYNFSDFYSSSYGHSYDVITSIFD